MKSNTKKKILTKEKQYQSLIDLQNKEGLHSLGLMTSHMWESNPARLVFGASRYKFVSKMLSGKKNVLEIGCSDGFLSKIVKQNVKKLTILDFDPAFIADFRSRGKGNNKWKMKSIVHDITQKPLKKNFDAIFCLDVLEHINPKKEKKFFENVLKSLDKLNGVFICGIPSTESQKYASKISKEGHVNCKTGEELKLTLKKYFNHNFIFSMNDEVLHTGFFPMSHYLFGVSCGSKK